MHITTLPFSQQIFQENLSSNVSNIITFEEAFYNGKTIVMRGIPKYYLENLLMASALKKEASFIQENIDRFIESSLLKYHLFFNMGKEIEFVYRGKTLRGNPEKFGSYIPETNWTDLFMACLLNRDMNAIKTICQ